MKKLFRPIVHLLMELDPELRFNLRATNRRREDLNFKPIRVYGSNDYSLSQIGRWIAKKLAVGDILRRALEFVITRRGARD